MSRAFGRKIKQDRAAAAAAANANVTSPGNVEDALITDNSTVTAPSTSSVYSESNKDWTLKKSQADKHRRVKSISDIDNITVTRV